MLDIAPTRHVFGDVDKVLALSYDHWFFLAQENDLPEVLIGGAAEHWLRTKLGQWSAAGTEFGEEQVAEYVRCFDAASIHATTEDYRAGATIDLEHDDATYAEGRRVDLPDARALGCGGPRRQRGTTCWRSGASTPTQVRGRADQRRPLPAGGGPGRDDRGADRVPRRWLDQDVSRAIDVVDLTMTYGDLTAVDGVSLAVEEGEFVGILGPNGAGKTTTLETIEGLRKPDAGSVTVLGEKVWPRNPKLLPRIGVQLQASSFFERLTAREQIHTFASLYGVSSKVADEWLGRVGLEDKADSRVEDLSGGQAQRLSIAVALVHDPDVVFLDEPTAALDPQARRNLWDLLAGLNDSGRTVVLTTHYMDEAEVLCDRVAIMDKGRILQFDSPVALIRGLDAPTRITLNDGEVISTHDPSAEVARLSAEGRLDGVRVQTGTLEDVFLDLTGREYRA